METINALEVFETRLTKTEIKSMAQQAVERVKEEGNPLAVAEAISCMETFIKEVKADESFKEYVRDEVSKNGKCFTSKSGAKVELAETGVKYFFTDCADPVHAELITQMEYLKIKIEEREKFLKSIPASGIPITDEQTGETFKVYPPSKISTSSYKITLSK